MKAINVKSVGNNKVSIKWDSGQWQYVVTGLDKTDTYFVITYRFNVYCFHIFVIY